MAQERLTMRKIRKVLRLKWECGLSNRAIARSCSISHSTVGEYLQRAEKAGLSWPLPADLTKMGCTNSSFPSRHVQVRESFLVLKRLKPSMRLSHRAGEKVFVDYAGQTVSVVDPGSGEIRQAQIFIGVLGASNYTYAEAHCSQDLANWTGAHVRMFAFFGGVPEIVVPDNLKAGVKHPCRYEPDLNPTYQDLAQHYGTAIIPTRVRKPKDKAKAEVGVQVVERWILARLRKHTFFSLADLNQAIRELLDQINTRLMKHLGRSRRELFELLDQPALLCRPLPVSFHRSPIGLHISCNLPVT